MHKITVLPTNRILEAAADTSLLTILQKAGLAPDAPCGGEGKCGKCRVIVNGREVLSCRTVIDRDMMVEIPTLTREQILTQGIARAQEGCYRGKKSLAFDIGTTTVAGYLLEENTGKLLATASAPNPQRAFGADVVSRIRLACSGHMVQLTDAIRDCVTELTAGLCQKAACAPAEIGVVCVVGNPTMQQLLLGIPVDNLARPPFAPLLTKADTLPAKACLPSLHNAELLVIPDIAGFVGADTVACVMATDMDRSDELTLLVDIGTNGEMVLIHEGRMTACSTAAGPALEGANIRFGMRGAVGAIDHVWEEDGELRYSVIGGGEPIGICGSGIIDAIAALLNQKKLNKRGRIQCTEEADGQRVLYLTEKIYLTQEDIRQVQIAKGAIAAGIQLMCGYLDITPERIDKVLLAGAFGSFLNPDSACRIELLPKVLRGKITACGNLAGAGAKLTAMSKKQFLLTQEMRDRIRFIELAKMPDFQKTFAKCMTFSE